MNALDDFWSYVTTGSNWTGGRGLLFLTWNHIRISVFATLAAALIAVPLGVVIGRLRRGGATTAAVVNIGRALPSFAVIVLAFSVFSEWGRGLSIWPTFVALVLLAIPPMFTNTYTGVRGVDPDVKEAAQGMGMGRYQVVTRVEAPIALPLIITGLRVSAVQVVATATLGAWVGYQCLGTLIFEGFAQQNDGKIVTGAVFVALLTIVTEIAFSLVARIVTPWESRQARSRAGDAAVDAATESTAPGSGAVSTQGA
jgi:osmoprotectant transport system permease protein